MNLTICILNYKNPSLTINCINSIIKFTKGIEYEIIVLDNGSNDGSFNILQTIFKKEVTLLKSDLELGFARGNNHIVRFSRGDYLFFFNNDAYLLDNSIKTLLDFISKVDSSKMVGIVGGNLFDENMNPGLSYEKKLPSIVRMYLNPLLSKLNLMDTHNFSVKPKKVGYVSGANLMIKKTLFNELGGFSNDLFLYFEETELTFRLNKIGYSSYSIPDARFIHIGGQSDDKSKTQIEAMLPPSHYLRSRYVYFYLTRGGKILPLVYFFAQLYNFLQYYKGIDYVKLRIVSERIAFKSYVNSRK